MDGNIHAPGTLTAASISSSIICSLATTLILAHRTKMAACGHSLELLPAPFMQSPATLPWDGYITLYCTATANISTVCDPLPYGIGIWQLKLSVPQIVDVSGNVEIGRGDLDSEGPFRILQKLLR
jgi:hypothetical protein